MSLSHEEAKKLIRELSGGRQDSRARDRLLLHLESCIACHAYAQDFTTFEQQLALSLKTHWKLPTLSSYDVRKTAGLLMDGAKQRRKSEKWQVFVRSLAFSGITMVIVMLLYWAVNSRMLALPSMLPTATSPVVVSTSYAVGSMAQTETPVQETATPLSATPSNGYPLQQYIQIRQPLAMPGTPMPAGKEAITPETLSRLTSLALWGQYSYSDMQLSPDGKVLAIASYESHQVLLLDAETLEETGSLGVRAYRLAFSPDSTQLATSDPSGAVQIWDVAQRTLIKRYYAYNVQLLVFSPDGKTLATSDHQQVQLWDELHNLRSMIPNIGPCTALTFSPDSQLLATGTQDGDVALWQVSDNHELTKLWSQEVHPTWVSALAFSADGSLLVSGSEKIYFWQSTNGKLIQELPVDQPIMRLAFSSDGKTLAAGGYQIDFWEMPSGKHIQSHPLSRDYVSDMAYLPDGQSMLIRSLNKIERWQIPDWTRLAYAKQPLRDVTAAALSPDNTILATGSGDDGLQLWNTTDGSLLAVYNKDIPIFTSEGFLSTTETQPLGTITDVAFSADGKLFAYGSEKGTVRVCNVADGETRAVHQWIGQQVTSLAFSPNSRYLATGGSTGEVDVVDLKDLERLQTLKTFLGTVNDIDFSPDGRTLAVGTGRNSVLLFHVPELFTDNKKGLYQIFSYSEATKDTVASLDYSPDGKYLAISFADNKTAPMVINVADGSTLMKMAQMLPSNYRLAFSPNGQLLAYGPWLYEVSPVSSGQPLTSLPLPAHTMLFSNDGKRLISLVPGGVWWWGIP